MHGRPREYKNKLKDPKAAEAYAKKVSAIKQGTALVLECRRQRRYDPAALKASEKLLKVVPEVSQQQHTGGGVSVVCMQQHSDPTPLSVPPHTCRSTPSGTTGVRRCSQCLRQGARQQRQLQRRNWRSLRCVVNPPPAPADAVRLVSSSLHAQ